jgi:hypothetical protein
MSAHTDEAARPAGRDWRAGLRWFGAEFLVVVTGVLVALVLNAWWGARQDRVRELAYLREIDRDLESTDSSLVRALDGIGRTRHATSALVRASYAPSEAPPDSLPGWLFIAEYVYLPTYSTGAADALVQTGQLGLIRDDSTRLAVFRMLDQVRHEQRREELVLDLIVPILQRERERTATTHLYRDAARLSDGGGPFEYARQLGAALPDRSAPFQTTYQSLLRREDAFRDWSVVSDHLIVLQTTYERALRVVRSTHGKVQAARMRLGEGER